MEEGKVMQRRQEKLRVRRGGNGSEWIRGEFKEARPEPRVSTNDPMITEHPSITDLRNRRPRPVRLDWFVFIAGRDPVDHDLDIIEAEPRRREIELWIEQFDRLVFQGE